MAIAYDNSASFTGGTGTINNSYTVNGTNPVLLVLCYNDANTNFNVSGVTYNSVALTSLQTNNSSGITSISLWYLLGPATGSNTLAVTLSSGQLGRILVASYNGVDQTNGINASGSGGHSNTTNCDISITTTQNGCWGVDLSVVAATPSAGTNINSIRIGAGTNYIIGDSNGSLGAAGTYTLQFTQTPSSQFLGGGGVGLLEAATATTVAVGTSRLLMGMGT